MSFVDFVWRARDEERGGVRDPRICFLLPECHMKLVNVAGNRLCLLLTSCGGACAFVWRVRDEERGGARAEARVLGVRAEAWRGQRR